MARAVQTQGVGVVVRPRLATGVGRSNNAWMQATSPTHVGSTGMLTDIKPERNKRPGRSGTTSNSGLQAAASVAALALVNAERSGGQPPRGMRAEAGEPGGNRTPNPQIKSLLLCQLSYRPAERFIVSHALRRARTRSAVDRKHIAGSRA